MYIHQKTALLAVLLLVVSLIGTSPGVDAAQQTVRVYVTVPSNLSSADIGVIRAAGGAPRHTFDAINTVSVDLPLAALTQISANSRFEVRPVETAYATEDTLPWGIDRVDAEVVWGGSNGAVNVANGAIDGTGVTVAVIDTGIGPHTDLNVVGGKSFVWYTSSFNDDQGHGTHVAGTVAARDNGSGVIGMAPGVDLLAVKVLGATGSGLLDDVAAGIEWATQNGADVINMSLACTVSIFCDDPAVNQAVLNAINSGVVVVAAAGNSGPGSDTVGWPAKNPNVIAVAATCSPVVTGNCNTVDLRAAFSSTGPAVEIAAPGDSVISTVPTSCFPNLDGFCNPTGLVTLSGTSMASPHVAGAAALLVACGYTNTEVRSILDSTADDLGATGRDNLFGFGILDVDEAMEGCDSPPPPVETGPAIAVDDFESGGWNGGAGWDGPWTGLGDASFRTVTFLAGPAEAAFHLQLRGGASVTRQFSLSGVTSTFLTFSAKAFSWEAGEGAAVQVSTNGSQWTTVKAFQKGFDDNVYHEYQVDLSQWDGEATMYLRFQAQMNSGLDFFWVDAIEISGDGGPPLPPICVWWQILFGLCNP